LPQDNVHRARGAGAFVFSGAWHGNQNKGLHFSNHSVIDLSRAPDFSRDTTNLGSSRHAAKLQLLAKRLLLLIAMSLNSKKILTIGIRIRSGS
jgi:hypothetical protein